jgi:hypothetical protein
MKTRIIHKPDQIQLVIDNPAKPKGWHDVLAAMELYEGTGCWQLMDIRLSKLKKPGPYACALHAEVLCASFEPKTKEDADFIKSFLREYQEQPDGEIVWCTFDGIVRGAPEIRGRKPDLAQSHQAGYFSRADGLAELKKTKEFWDNIESLDSNWRIENPHLQPTEHGVTLALLTHKQKSKTSQTAEQGDDDAGPNLV